jgi:hypothetical protein
MTASNGQPGSAWSSPVPMLADRIAEGPVAVDEVVAIPLSQSGSRSSPV